MLAISPRQILADGTVRQHGAPASQQPFVVRLLGADDLPTLETFRTLIFEALPDIDAYFPETQDFAALHLGDRGVTFGAEVEGRLIACAVIGLPRAGLPSFAADLAEPRPAPEVTAHMASCMVHPDYRGNHLQKYFVGLRTLYAVAAGRPHHLTRIALSNPVSLRNMLDCGYTVRRILVMHGTRYRYLLYRDLLSAPTPFDAAALRIIAIRDRDAQMRAIDDGLIGVQVVDTAAGVSLAFAAANGPQRS
ncbi:MAG: hypothetical protein P4M00_24550 [Azospirillaceae bacterium]|nr:hypothetical protein [Azospirillaceae bacterium]